MPLHVKDKSSKSKLQRKPSKKNPPSSEAVRKLRQKLNAFESKMGISDFDLGSLDRDLTKAEFFKVPPQEKGKRTLLSFFRKVCIIVEMVDDDDLRAVIPQRFFSTRTALRRWTDESRKLWAWSVPDIDSPRGDYADLTSIYIEAEAGLDALLKGKKFSLKREIDEKNRIIENLELQILDLMDQLNGKNR